VYDFIKSSKGGPLSEGHFRTTLSGFIQSRRNGSTSSRADVSLWNRMMDTIPYNAHPSKTRPDDRSMFVDMDDLPEPDERGRSIVSGLEICMGRCMKLCVDFPTCHFHLRDQH